MFTELWPGWSLDPTTVRQRLYTKEEIPVVSCCHVDINYERSVSKVIATDCSCWKGSGDTT